MSDEPMTHDDAAAWTSQRHGVSDPPMGCGRDRQARADRCIGTIERNRRQHDLHQVIALEADPHLLPPRVGPLGEAHGQVVEELVGQDDARVGQPR